MAGFAGDPGSGCSCKRLGSKALSVEKLPIFSRLPISLDPSRRCLRRSDLKDAELVDLGEASRISLRESQGYWPSLPAQHTCPGLLASPALPVQVAGSSLISELRDAAPRPEPPRHSLELGTHSASAPGSREC